MKEPQLNGTNGPATGKHSAKTTIGINGKSTSVRRRSPRFSSNNNDDDDECVFLSGTVVTGSSPPQLNQQPEPDDNEVDQVLSEIPTRTEVLLDLANLCTFAGTIFATLSMASMWQGRYYAGMCFNVAANIADILDGPVARATANRRPAFSAIGCKLDCYSDLVSHFVVPASLLMHLSDTHPVCTALASFYICAGILRQSYFEVTGRCEDGACIYGLTSDYMVAMYAITMHACPLIDPELMPYVMSACIVSMIYASLTFSLRSRRYDGFGLVTVSVYNVFLLISCLVLCFCQTSDNLQLISGLLLAANLVLAYPCYFRFVELNI